MLEERNQDRRPSHLLLPHSPVIRVLDTTRTKFHADRVRPQRIATIFYNLTCDGSSHPAM